jgi:hypothetical protein
MTRAEKFLEGFKLGSLGVSRKPKVITNDPEVETLKQGKYLFSDSFAVKYDLPYFYWKDPDGWKYCLMIEGRSTPAGADFNLWMLADENLEIQLSPIGLLIPKNKTDWQGNSPRMSDSDATSLYERLVTVIKQGGVRNLIEKDETKWVQGIPGMYGREFNKWLKDRKKQFGVI